jgi:diguanylate cyclase (GGDEF)-like protein
MPAMEAPLPPNESQRLAALHLYDVLDTARERAFDDITKLAAYICDVPVALVSFVDEDRQWFKSKVGLEFTQTPRSISFCAHAILQPGELMVVHDASRDARFSDNPMVTGEPNVRFYAGAPLISMDGQPLGTLCVLDKVPRELDAMMEDSLKALARQVVAQLELRRALDQLARHAEEQEQRQRELEAYQNRLEDINLVLARQSATDALTGLENRRAFDRVLNEESSRTERSRSPLSLAIIDVDHFKLYNDEFGHLAGDEALQQVALVLQAQARTYDHVARYGGEEFAVVLPDTPFESAMVVAERIRAAVQNSPWAHKPLTVSIGVATTTSVADSMTILERADKGLYQAKAEGRNRVVQVADA